MRWIRQTLKGALPLLPLFFAVMVSSVIEAQVQTTGELPRTARGLYMSACSNCHGIDGTGSARAQMDLGLPLPDFTDCNFASREPYFDWIAVAHQGGPVRGFSRLMPAFGEALTEEQIRLTLEHIQTFCESEEWPPGDLNLPRALITEKAYPEDEAVYTAGIATEGRGQVTGEVVYEQRFGARNQLELVVPFGWREGLVEGADGDSEWGSSLGDVAVGAKRNLFHSLESGSIFSVAGEVLLPTGDEESGFGSGTVTFEPFVSYGQILPSDFFFQSQVGFELPVDRDQASNEGFWRFSLGRSFNSRNFGRTWSPMVEFLGASEFEDGTQTDWDVLPQVQITLNARQHIMANVGVRIPMTNTEGRQTEFLVYLLWDWFDGTLFEGW